MEPTNFNDDLNSEGDNLQKEPASHRLLKIILTSVIALLIAAGLFISLQKSADNTQVENTDLVNSFDKKLEESIYGKDQEPLQEYFVQDIEQGKNDANTKSAIYWITHRYFDNGGDIYEIYDFIESNPNLAFLKEAEEIYPDSFKKIKSEKVANYSFESLLALLAYYKVIDNNGYANISIWGLAANKYSEIALAFKPDPSDKTELAEKEVAFYNHSVTEAGTYLAKIDNFIINNTINSGKLDELIGVDNISNDDLLVGLNQYTSAAIHLKGADQTYTSVIDPAEIYEFNSNFALTEVPRLYFFTNYVYATALVRGGQGTSETVAVALDRAIEYADSDTLFKPSEVISRVINSKNTSEFGVYSYAVSKQLASLHPEFKAWLGRNGWEAKDF